ncbi:unnamed protein product [Ambrosiozyma monospora]|uniref:Unnamed protein product n=1 Tax=Ambrosiozyma monospora TaxID=43982 RepID=A0ACB5U8T1_AMBMO|nr:unnamed protein product [Ambrosiozyma monospora]
MERYLGLTENDDGSLALDPSLDEETVGPLPLLVLYDGKSDGSVNGNGIRNIGWGLCCLAEKFVGSDEVPGWGKGNSRAKAKASAKAKGNGKEDQGMFVLNGGFQEFIKSYPSLVESGCSSISSSASDNDNDSSISSSNNHPKITVSSPSSASSSSGVSSLLQSQSPFGTSFPPSLKTRSQSQSPIVSTHSKSKNRKTHMKSPSLSLSLSHFALPDTSNIPFFKSRHHEELITNRPDLTLHLTTTPPPLDNDNNMNIKTNNNNNEDGNANGNGSGSVELPQWLKDVFGCDLGATELARKFAILQTRERDRINYAILNSKKTLKVVNGNGQ